VSDERLPDLYLEAVELGADRRRELLDRLRLAEPALAAELARLLAASPTRSPIDGSALEAAGVERRDSPPPLRVGPYRIVRELGRGGMGRVFLAEHETPDFRRTVALKLIGDPGPDEGAVRRFRDEVRILAALDHPGIVRFYDGGRSPEGTWFLAQEYVDGDHLLEHVRRHRLSVAQRVALFCDVLEVVHAAHARGVVHRDLKPSNVLVGADHRPRLLDFGISKLVDTDTGPAGPSTRTEARALTPAYASPEQIAGRSATAASDLYSLGVILYELLAGARPVAATPPSHGELAHAAGARGPVPPSVAARRSARAAGEVTTDPAVPPPGAREIDRDLDAICLEALRPEPGERFASAADFAAELQRWLEGRPVEARRHLRAHRFGVARQGEPPPTALAVLPFADLSPGADQQHFCDGLAEELIHVLGRVDGLRLASRGASFRFRGHPDPGVVGDALRVTNLLEGSVRKAGERLRITVQLVRTADSVPLWSERWDRELQDVFAIQDEIAERVADALRLVLATGGRDARRLLQPVDAAAYDYYLRGRQYFYRFTRSGVSYAIDMFRRALELDPTYGLAWAGLADCHSWRRMWFAGGPDDLRAADEASARAAALAPRLAEAHAARGLAVSLAGRHDEAAGELAAALELDPGLFEAHYFWGRSCVMQGRLDEAAEHFETAAAVRPEDYQAPRLLALAYGGLGRPAQQLAALRVAVDAAERHLRLNPDDARAYYLGAASLVQLGERERGLEWAERALAIEPREPCALYSVGCVYAVDGQTERGLELLERAVDCGFGSLEWIVNDPDWERVRDSPRFRAVLGRLGGGPAAAEEASV
jgi:serine/threonine protein kinase/TolB-like protein/Flp pilus assembly protein TadD